MTYFIIGAVVILILMSPLGSEFKRGYDSFVSYLYLKNYKGDKLRALQEEREADKKSNEWVNNKLGGFGSSKHFGFAILLTLLVWPLMVGCYLLSFKFHP